MVRIDDGFTDDELHACFPFEDTSVYHGKSPIFSGSFQVNAEYLTNTVSVFSPAERGDPAELFIVIRLELSCIFCDF